MYRLSKIMRHLCPDTVHNDHCFRRRKLICWGLVQNYQSPIHPLTGNVVVEELSPLHYHHGDLVGGSVEGAVYCVTDPAWVGKWTTHHTLSQTLYPVTVQGGHTERGRENSDEVQTSWVQETHYFFSQRKILLLSQSLL